MSGGKYRMWLSFGQGNVSTSIVWQLLEIYLKYSWSICLLFLLSHPAVCTVYVMAGTPCWIRRKSTIPGEMVEEKAENSLCSRLRCNHHTSPGWLILYLREKYKFKVNSQLPLLGWHDTELHLSSCSGSKLGSHPWRLSFSHMPYAIRWLYFQNASRIQPLLSTSTAIWPEATSLLP